jgi:hypothetical protein
MKFSIDVMKVDATPLSSFQFPNNIYMAEAQTHEREATLVPLNNEVS